MAAAHHSRPGDGRTLVAGEHRRLQGGDRGRSRIPALHADADDRCGHGESGIVKQAELLHDALAHLKGFKGLDRYWIEVHRLENEGDRIARAAIADLFHGDTDPVNLVKWKDVYGLLEATIDKAEDVANIIERITIKHA